jgi:hypothetical protein
MTLVTPLAGLDSVYGFLPAHSLQEKLLPIAVPCGERAARPSQVELLACCSEEHDPILDQQLPADFGTLHSLIGHTSDSYGDSSLGVSRADELLPCSDQLVVTILTDWWGVSSF